MNHKSLTPLMVRCSALGRCSRSLSVTATQSYKKRVTDVIDDVKVRGIDILRNPHITQGTAFTIEERQLMGLHGLLPARVNTQDAQAFRCMENFRRCSSDLERFTQLMSLLDRNEKLFYRIVGDNITDMMPVIYTPTVGLACQKYGLIFSKPRGLFITIHDIGHVYDILCNWPSTDVHAICVTDGERILGLGDLGAYGMGIPVGKLALYTAIAGIKPEKCLPIYIDVGTENDALLDDRLYIGLKQHRERGSKYTQLMDEFMEACTRRYGNDTLIQFEDFGQDNAFMLLDRYRNDYLTFNDDIQGTASVAVAGILCSLRISQRPLRDNVFLFQGAGQAATGIAQLLSLAMVEDGCTKEEAESKIWMLDIDGLVTLERPGNTDYKSALKPFAKNHQHMTDIHDIIDKIKPTAIIGASAVRDAFDEKVLRTMATLNERPIIFALSNPTSKAECTAEACYTFTEGRGIFASGSPFADVVYNGQTFKPGQGNNAYIFPAIALAVTVFKARRIPDKVFLKTCQLLANHVTQDDLDAGRVYPPLKDINEVSIKMAIELGDFLYRENLARYTPEPKNKERFLRGKLYKTEYESFVPKTWAWP